MPTLGERIVEHLAANGASLDDGELADALGVGRRVIAETCRQLEAQGLVVRNMAGGTRTVVTVPAGQPPDRLTPSTFPAHARRVLSARWGTSLQRRPAGLPGGQSQLFDLVSGNGRIVGDVVWLAGRGETAEVRSAAIAEAVLVVAHVANADRRFLVFGDDWDTVSRWVTRYRGLLDGDRLERLA